MNIKSRKAADPDLNLIARRLLDIQWQTELDDHEKIECRDRSTNNDLPRHLLSPMPDLRTWSVRMFMGGAQRVLGYVKGPDLTTGLRFADMAKMYFWKYKVRGAHEPGNLELNLSVDRVRQDLDNEPGAVGLLKEIEAYLLGIGAINTSEDKERLRREERDKRRKERTVSGLLGTLNTNWMLHIQEMEATIAAQTKEIAALSGKLDQVLAQRVYTPSVFPVPTGGPPGLASPQTGDPLPPPYTVTCGGGA